LENKASDNKGHTMSESTREQALADEILSDARRQAERKLERARKRAERMVHAAQAKVAGIEQEAMDTAKQKLEAEQTILMADVPHQDLLRTLCAQDAAIRGLFDDVLNSLAERQEIDLPEVLTRLSADAIALMTGDTFVLELAEPDATAHGAALTERVAEAIKARSGRAVTLRVAASDRMPQGGVVVRSDRELVDHSFANRAKQAERALRARLAALIFGETNA
jgi:vacuolar-type H+-ATPase subunit E/Vma4